MQINHKQGFTLVETVIYVASAVLLIGVIATMMFYMYGWYGDATVIPRVDQAGTTLVDRIVRDVRSGTSINITGTLLNATLGSLALTSNPNGTSVTKAFAVSNGRVTYSENSSTASYLTPTGMTVTKLMFTQITNSTISTAVRVECEITYTTRKGTFVRSYSGAAVMRNSYQ